MKRFCKTIFLTVFVLLIFQTAAHSPAYAACNWALNPANGAVTATTCGIDAASSEYYDYSSAADDATNGYTVTIPTAVTVTVNAGTSSSAKTFLGVGVFSMTGGTIAVSSNFISVSVGSKCYVPDRDDDLYSPTPTTCSTTGVVGYIRKNKLTATTVDCGDASANAKPSQASYLTGTFTNGVNASLTHDWNCNGTETQQYPTATYTCASCTNGSGYGSTQNTTNGFQTSVPACNVAGTYYTVTNATCQDPAVAGCTGAYTTSSVTQACL